MRARQHNPLQEWLESEEALQILQAAGISYGRWELNGWEQRISAVLTHGPFAYAFTLDFGSVAIPYLDGGPWDSLPLHYHNNMEARLMLSGQLSLRVQTAAGQLLEVELLPGDFVVIPPGLCHRVDLVARRPLSCLCLATSPESLVPIFQGSVLTRYGN